jgi:hypothetical protein
VCVEQALAQSHIGFMSQVSTHSAIANIEESLHDEK